MEKPSQELANCICHCVSGDGFSCAEFLVRTRPGPPLDQILPKAETILQWLEDFLKKEVLPTISKKGRARVNPVLIPPGDCIHFFRDGVGFTGTHTPCDFFSSIEFSRTIIDDHLIMSGYHRALVTFMRDSKNDHKVSQSRERLSISTRNSHQQIVYSLR